MIRRHPSRARLLAGDDRALRHAETCDRCADLLLEEDDRGGLGSLLKAVLDPTVGFQGRAVSGTAERIRLQDLWELFGDTAGGVGDALRILAGTGVPDTEAPNTEAGTDTDAGTDTPTDDEDE